MMTVPSLGDFDVQVARLPEAFHAWEAEPEQMPAGAPGKIGALWLEFARIGDRTRLLRDYSAGPQQVRRAMYLDPLLPDIAFAMVQSVSGGVLQGDRLATWIRVGEGARAHVTTQAATKIYRMDHNYATSRLTFTVENGGYCEYLPDFLIPCRSARFYQEIEVNVAPEGVLILGDLLAPGRVGYGESFDFDLVCTQLSVRDLEGRLRFKDYVRLEPAVAPSTRPGLLARHSYYGSLLALTGTVPPDRMLTKVHQDLQGMTAVAGASLLPYGDGVVLRVAGGSSAEVQSAVSHAWSALRESLLGAPAPPIFRSKYGFGPTSPGAPAVPGKIP